MAERFSEAQLTELKSRNPCDQVAERLGVRLRRAGRKMVGPCPMCSEDKLSKDATRFEADADGWLCAVCPGGGDVIKLIMKAQDLDFVAAVEWLGGARSISKAEAAEIDAASKAKAARRERDAAYYREQERKETYIIYGDGHPIEGSAAAEYLARRHLEAPATAYIRFLPELAYFESVGTPSRKDVIHRGPAMLTPIVRSDGHFAGLHTTYLGPAGKLELKHPETGEALPAKKVRGSKSGNRIELVRSADPHTLVIGEGIETVLSVWRAFAEDERPLDGVAFWASVDLGNLGGRALKSIRHPTLKTDKGRPRSVPGPDPDPASPAIAIPDTVTRVILLGDGDSEALLTQCAVYRAAARWARPGREILAAWSPDGTDFNDLAPDWSRILEVVDAAAPPAKPADSAAADTNDAPRQRRARSTSSPSPGDAAAPKSADVIQFPGSSAEKNFSAASPRPPQKNEESLQILAGEDGRVPEGTIIEASTLDHSDTDNGKRLRLYFGEDLCVMAQVGSDRDAWISWTGHRWDIDGGEAGARIIAQRVGELIKAEADVMVAMPDERKAIEAGQSAQSELNATESAADDAASKARRLELLTLIEAGKAARRGLQTRRKDRRKHAVTSKNSAKIDAMLRCLAPHLRRSPDDFNRDAMLVVTKSHTLRFLRPEQPGGKARVDAVSAHNRADLVTAMIPFGYDPKADCPRFRANMERFQPDNDQRRTVQQFTGLGLLGLPIQKVMFHYGSGGNFKSVFLETIMRTLGDSFAIGLPTESVSGREDRNAGSASPDLARVFGKRMLRVLELPDGVPLQAGTIKKLTGGEKWPVRTLFKGYFEFQPRAKTHMSGNSLPTFDGGDGGMRRRLMMVEWPVALAESEQRDFEVVVSELMEEGPGILNWLIDGALDFLTNGLFVAAKVAALTREQIEEMDPIGQFFKDCVEPDPEGVGVQARPMYGAYRDWSEANAKRVRSENKFGREMRKLCRRDDTGRVHVYVGVRLHDVPAGNHQATAGYGAAGAPPPDRERDDDVLVP